MESVPQPTTQTPEAFAPDESLPEIAELASFVRGMEEGAELPKEFSREPTVVLGTTSDGSILSDEQAENTFGYSNPDKQLLAKVGGDYEQARSERMSRLPWMRHDPVSVVSWTGDTTGEVENSEPFSVVTISTWHNKRGEPRLGIRVVSPANVDYKGKNLAGNHIYKTSEELELGGPMLPNDPDRLREIIEDPNTPNDHRLAAGAARDLIARNILAREAETNQVAA